MKKRSLFLSLIFVTGIAVADTSLFIQPLVGNELVNALSTIGHIKMTSDSLFVYSHGDLLLAKSAIKDIHHMYYGESTITTGIDDVNSTAIRIYPNPAQDLLVLENANAQKALIFDMSGHLIRSISLHDDVTSINVAALPQGEYLILLNTQTFKFIKK